MNAELNYPPGVTQAMHAEAFADSCEPDCAACGRPIRPEDTASVEIVNTKVPGEAEYFCSNDCRSSQLYSQTPTANGRAALIRFVAALQLLSDEDVLAQAPTLARYECDEVEFQTYPTRRRIEVQQFREQAMAFLRVLGGEDGVDWAAKACDLAETVTALAGKAAA